MVGRVFSDGTVQLSITVDTADYNVQTAASSPASAVDISITIAAGVVVYQSAGAAALRAGTLPAGTKVTIINRGYIVGVGGSGGGGGNAGLNGSSGTAGGDAIWIESGAFSIDNSSGFIGGGGGGGGGGGSSGSGGGGGGGGGRGRNGGSGGSGGSPSGSSGDSGSFAGAGNGGDGAFGVGDGGDGGDWGSVGSNGEDSVYSAGGGGAPGKAVRRTSGTLVWLGGYDSSRVQGAVD